MAQSCEGHFRVKVLKWTKMDAIDGDVQFFTQFHKVVALAVYHIQSRERYSLERALEQLWLILEEGNFDEFDDSLKRIGQEFPHLIVVKMRKSYAFDFETPLANGVLT